MEISLRSFRVALRILIPFLLILFFTSVSCRIEGPRMVEDYGDPSPGALTQNEEFSERPAETLIVIPTETPIVIPTVTPNPTQVAYVSGFAGSWDTNWGVMTCSVDGQRVNCNYTYDNGKIEATLGLDGMTMEGTWSEAPSYQPPEDGGRVTFSLSEDGNTITGSWWYGQNGEGGPWTGTRK